MVRRLCAALGAVPGWAYRPDGSVFDPAEVAVVSGPIPDAPDRAIGVTVYGSQDDVDEARLQRLVQVRLRGPKNDPDGAARLSLPSRSVLEGLSRVGGISGIRRVSVGTLGSDSGGRFGRTENYLATLDNQEAIS